MGCEWSHQSSLIAWAVDVGVGREVALFVGYCAALAVGMLLLVVANRGSLCLDGSGVAGVQVVVVVTGCAWEVGPRCDVLVWKLRMCELRKKPL